MIHNTKENEKVKKKNSHSLFSLSETVKYTVKQIVM